MLLPSLKVEALLQNSILSTVRNSGALGLIAAEDMVLLRDLMDIMDLMVLVTMAEVAAEDPLHPHHLPSTREQPTLLHLTSMSLRLARPALTLLPRLLRNLTITPILVTQDRLIMDLTMGPTTDLIIMKSMLAEAAVDVAPPAVTTITLAAAHPHSPST